MRINHQCRKSIFFACLVTSGTVSLIMSSEVPKDDVEINRLKKEIAQVKMERLRVREDIQKDKIESAAYVARTASRKAGIVAETDSIRKLIAVFEHKKDSLGASLAAIVVKRKNNDMVKERFKEHIASACKKLMAAIKRYPPAVSRPAVGALTFLINDCASKNIDNKEALQRLFQITKNLDEATLITQTGQEASSSPTMHGTVFTLRIGTVFQAQVDDDAKKAALWQYDGTDSRQWRTISEDTASMISKAISVRESKALPAFVPLPWGNSPKGGIK